MQDYRKTAKGFTLIELLVVIAILVVLSVVVILTLNPAELLRQSRDSTRISDMATLKSSLALYLVDVTSPNLGSSANCYVQGIAGLASPGCGGRFTAGTNNVSTSVAVDGSGWIPVRFDLISGGSPISAIPTDPASTTLNYYAYRVSTLNPLQYEVNMKLESLKYASTTSSGDGGSDVNLYEGGTAPGLAL